MSRRFWLIGAVGAIALIAAPPAHAFFRIKWDPIKDITGKPLHEHGRKLTREVGNALRDIDRERLKITNKTIKEIGNAAEDIRILVQQGKCGGDICDALNATVKYVEATIVDTGDIIANTAKRIEEGKILDAMWHLAVDPLNAQQENAAEAAAKSSVLRAVGQVAAGVYGGPGGAAAYAAWLTYNMTDGNLELALRAGAISGATAYAMSQISDVQGIEAIKGVKIDAIAQRAALSGAIAGMAVAASGGSEADINNAVTAGIVMAVIRDGYKELTTTRLEDNLKASTGEPYCLAANPNSGLDCLPPPEAYLRNADGSIKYRGVEPEIDITKLDALRPHVGMFAKTAQDNLVFTESTEFMQAVSRVPGMNAMAVGHDIIDSRFNRINDLSLSNDALFALELVVRVGTIAPSVVMTYEGAGYRVQEMIRAEAVERSQTSAEAAGAAPAPGQSPTSSATPPAHSTSVVPPLEPVGRALVPSGPIFEIRNLVCAGPSSTTAALLETHLEPSAAGEGGRICTVHQAREEGWRLLWHAHHDAASCARQINAVATRALARGERCWFSNGVRYGEPGPTDGIEVSAR